MRNTMKCKVCGGTGTSNTCVNGTFKPCTFCDGTGEYEPFDADVELDKLYPTEQTNEEWMKSLDTEDFAEAIFAFMDSVSQELTGEKITNKEDVKREVVIKWLKETYDEM